MTSTIVVDSSILVGALVDGQSDHAVCQQFFRRLTPEIMRARRASHVAIQRELRGMDALVVAAAQEFRATLVTLDSEMIERAKTLVPIAKPQDFV